MKTSIPVSTITWNSKDFYFGTLQKLLETNIIEFYCTIYHFSDNDNKKDHYHLYIIPNGKVDLDKLRKLFEEDAVGGIIRPLPFHKSPNFGDWYLYSMHDESYLAHKAITRNYHYQQLDFIYSDEDYFDYLVGNIAVSKYNLLGIVESAVKQKIPWDKFVCSKIVPANQFKGYESYYNAMWRYYWDVHHEREEELSKGVRETVNTNGVPNDNEAGANRSTPSGGSKQQRDKPFVGVSS